jgi:homogentisate 1,2-dioxygenase
METLRWEKLALAVGVGQNSTEQATFELDTEGWVGVCQARKKASRTWHSLRSQLEHCNQRMCIVWGAVKWCKWDAQAIK